MSAVTRIADPTGDDLDAAEHVAERFPTASVSVWGSTGTIAMNVEYADVETGRCIEVADDDAPKGYELESASLHDDGSMMATFVPTDDEEGESR